MFGDANQIKKQVTRIGNYHYNLFLSSYGAPMYLNKYKCEYLWIIFYLLYFTITVAFDPLPAFNKAVDYLTEDPRVAYAFYWSPTILYLGMTIAVISDFMSQIKRATAFYMGVFALVWHIVYFIVFWTANSKYLPSVFLIINFIQIQSVNDMSPSAGIYWTELFINLITLIIQKANALLTHDYPSFYNQKFAFIKQDIKSYFDLRDVEANEHHLPESQARPQTVRPPTNPAPPNNEESPNININQNDEADALNEGQEE